MWWEKDPVDLICYHLWRHLWVTTRWVGLPRLHSRTSWQDSHQLKLKISLHVGTATELSYCFYKILWKAKVFNLLSHSHHFRENRVWRLTTWGKWPHPIEAWEPSKVHFTKAHFIGSQLFTKPILPFKNESVWLVFLLPNVSYMHALKSCPGVLVFVWFRFIGKFLHMHGIWLC